MPLTFFMSEALKLSAILAAGLAVWVALPA